MKVLLIVFFLVPLFTIPAFAQEELDCESIEKERKELQECYTSGKCPYEGVSRGEVFERIGELTMKIRNSCLSPEELCGLGNGVYFDGECLRISELPNSVQSKATMLCQDALDSYLESQRFGGVGGLFNLNACMKEKSLILLTEPELLEPEPAMTADDQYKMICSGIDGYCMSKYGMNNPDAYGECLGTWVPFCRTYEAKQTPVTTSEIVCGAGTVLKDGFCVPERASMTTEMQQKSRGGCLIATATFGSELAPQVQQLREIRDNSLLQTESGSVFMESFNQFYYSFSPGMADLERENPVFKEAVKLTITPLLASLSLLNYVDIDSEFEVLGYGIGIILLNVGMYFVLPAFVIHRVRKFV